MRSESVRAVSGLLLGYDALGGSLARDRRGVDRAGLEGMRAALANPALEELRDAHDSFVRQLLALDADARNASPMRVNQLLEAQARINAAASQLPAGTQVTLKQRLHRLSLAFGQVLLLYGVRPYGGLVVYPGLPLTEGALESLDRQIAEDLEQLSHEGGQVADVVGLAARNYRFVRPKLFDSREGFAEHGIDRYLGQAILRLDEFAAQL
ncbi:hypothetical protein NG726_08610 [Pseudomonas sp. MOB-449]|nr:hypothetical protein [Pseudomonas sp. MOB-449]